MQKTYDFIKQNCHSTYAANPKVELMRLLRTIDMRLIHTIITTAAILSASTAAHAQLPERLDIAYSKLNDGCHINTLEHFSAAVDAGFNCLKADMQLTSDGVIVLCHDNGFTFDADGRIGKFDRCRCTKIRTLSYKQIRKMEYATGKASKGRYPKVATLEELARFAKKAGVRIYITVRNYNQEETLTEVVRVLKKTRMTEQTIINNYRADDKTCAIIRQFLPDTPISYTTTKDQLIDEAFVDKVARFAPVMICANRNRIPTPEVVKYMESKGVRALGWYPDNAEEYAKWLGIGLSGAQITKREVILPTQIPF